MSGEQPGYKLFQGLAPRKRPARPLQMLPGDRVGVHQAPLGVRHQHTVLHVVEHQGSCNRHHVQETLFADVQQHKDSRSQEAKRTDIHAFQRRWNQLQNGDDIGGGGDDPTD